jgi:hypothetical protein
MSATAAFTSDQQRTDVLAAHPENRTTDTQLSFSSLKFPGKKKRRKCNVFWGRAGCRGRFLVRALGLRKHADQPCGALCVPLKFFEEFIAR